MTTEWIIWVAMNSLLCFGIRAATFSGNVLGWVRPVWSFAFEFMEIIRAIIGNGNYPDYSSTREFLAKPIFGCVKCMASVWGLFFVGVLDIGIDIYSWEMLVHICMVSGFSFIVESFFNALENG